MLRYSIKPFKERKLTEFDYRNLYVSPDLKYISGVTDYSVGLVNKESVYIKSPYLVGSETNVISVSESTIQGKLLVKIELPVKSITKTLKFDILAGSEYTGNVDEEESGTEESTEWFINVYNGSYQIINEVGDGQYVYKTIIQKYVEYNGEISYYFNDVEDERKCGYLIGHKFYNAKISDDTVVIDEYINIEDYVIKFDNDITYSADFSIYNGNNEEIKPQIKLSKYTEPISGGDYLGLLNGNKCYAVSDEDNTIVIVNWESKKWEKIKKFEIHKNNNPVLDTDDVYYGVYDHFIEYKGKNYEVKDIYSDDENHSYIGYGAILDTGFAECEVNYNAEKEDKYIGVFAKLPETDKYTQVENTLKVNKTHGKIVVIILSDENTDIIPGNIIEANSLSPLSFKKIVEEAYVTNVSSDGFSSETRSLYVTFLGKKYDVKKKLYDTINIAGIDYKLTYTDGYLYSSAYIYANGEKLDFDIKYYSGGSDNDEVDYDTYEESDSVSKRIKATYRKNMFYSTGQPLIVRYGLLENSYDVNENSGVTINKTVYKVVADDAIYDENYYTEGDSDETGETEYAVNIEEKVTIDLQIAEINGSATLVCIPIVNEDEFDDNDIEKIKHELSSVIVDNRNTFSFNLKRNVFGETEFLAENGLMDSMTATYPYVLSDSHELSKRIKIYRYGSFISMNIPFTNMLSNDILKEDLINNVFNKEVEEKSINRIVDMEKDIYYPGYTINDELYPIFCIRFNMHFRTRNLDNWKIIEDDREFTKGQIPNTDEYNVTNYTYNSNRCNWFVTDYNYYKNGSPSTEYNKISRKSLHNASDLLGYLNFTNEDVYNQAAKIKKSFLRLSFYSTNNPETQVLLGTSTIFLDGQAALAKYLYLKRNTDINYVNTQVMQKAGYNTVDEYLEDSNPTYQVTSNTSSVEAEVLTTTDYVPDDLRLSSRIYVYDKYTSHKSSEGFYMYMFKEYTPKMREGIIYMKIEFNHAGIGKSIPMIVPRKNMEDGIGTPLYLHNDNDLATLKNGFKLKELNEQLYFPLYVKYSDKDNRFYYYIPKQLRENEELGVSDEVMEFNLFEIKNANESLIDID